MFEVRAVVRAGMLVVWLSAAVMLHGQESGVEVPSMSAIWMSPTTGEWLAAVAKRGAFDWSAIRMEPTPTQFTSRPQLALNLGMLLSRAHISAAAGDGQSLLNGVRDILVLAEALGVSGDLPARAGALAATPAGSDRIAAPQAIDDMFEMIRRQLQAQRDAPLVELAELGMFADSLRAVTSPVLAPNAYDPSFFDVGGPSVWFRDRLRNLPEEASRDPSVMAAGRFLDGLAALPQTPAPATEEASAAAAHYLHECAVTFLRALTEKSP